MPGKYVKHKGQLYVAMYDYYKFDAENPPSIEEVTKRWAKDNDKPNNWSGLTIDYPLEEVWQYREYSRSPMGDSNLTKEEWAALNKSLKEKGWDREQPLMLLVGKNGVSKVGEGNHRLWVAKQLGLKNIPVRFGGFWKNVERGVGRGPVI